MSLVVILMSILTFIHNLTYNEVLFLSVLAIILILTFLLDIGIKFEMKWYSRKNKR